MRFSSLPSSVDAMVAVVEVAVVLVVAVVGVVGVVGVAAASACSPVAAPCSRDDECAGVVCVDGRCVERGIGETTDPLERGARDRAGLTRDVRDALDRDARDRDANGDADGGADGDGLDRGGGGALDAREGSRLRARPIFTTPGELPPPLNDDDGDLPSSCLHYLEEHEDAASGPYTIRGRSGDATLVYCDMESDGGGWTIVADIARDGCPAGWASTTFGDCDRPGLEQISSAHFPLLVDYSAVRGSARGISGGDNRGFDVGFAFDGAVSDGLYVDGLALTVNDASERKHLWTFAAGGPDPYHPTACPSEPGGASPPTDVDGSYSCDKPRGLSYVLWDGLGLGGEGGDDENAENQSEDVGDFRRADAPQGDEIEARIMSPPGYQSTVYIMDLTIAVR